MLYNRAPCIFQDITMSKLKLEPSGLMIHKKMKEMVKQYGIMVTGVPAEIIGQMQAERILARINNRIDIPPQILEEITTAAKSMTEPADSCGQTSNEVCQLLLGKIEAEKFHQADYIELSAGGENLKDSLSNKNLLIRFEVDRANYPHLLIKVNRENFNPETATRHAVYLLENQLFYFDRKGAILDLEQSEKKCNSLFHAIGSQKNYCLCDPYTLENPENTEDLAINDIARIFNEQKNKFDCWVGTHSFTILLPMSSTQSHPLFYPYQSYFGSHTLQDWFSSDKDDYLSQMGLDKYIEKLVLLGKAKNTKERSDTYAELFSRRGREQLFCAHLNEKTEQLRVKFKITEFNPEIALNNLNEIQEFINTYPGENPLDKIESYKSRAKSAMTKRIQDCFNITPSSNEFLFWKNRNKTEEGDSDYGSDSLFRLK